MWQDTVIAACNAVFMVSIAFQVYRNHADGECGMSPWTSSSTAVTLYIMSYTFNTLHLSWGAFSSLVSATLWLAMLIQYFFYSPDMTTSSGGDATVIAEVESEFWTTTGMSAVTSNIIRLPSGVECLPGTRVVIQEDIPDSGVCIVVPEGIAEPTVVFREDIEIAEAPPESKEIINRLAVLTSDIDGLMKGTWVRVEDADAGVLTVIPVSRTADERKYKAFEFQVNLVIPACGA